MFEALTDKLSAVFQKLGRHGRLTEKDIDEALREVRVALLEADVNFKVVRSFVAKVKEKAVGAAVLESITPAQQVVKIVNDELVEILGGAQAKLTNAPQPPTIVMLVGLQGSGKTTTAAKLALHLKKQGQRVLLVAADVKRPAAVDQLVALGKQLDLPVYDEGTTSRAPDVCSNAMRRAREVGATWVLLDTAGRLQIDEDMMSELGEIKDRLHPHESLLVVDAMTGQEAVNVATEFHAKVTLTGLILTKMDGDARGGAALSIHSSTGVPIKFMGTGEKVDALEPYYPDRLASRILGMGDVLSLVEKAQAVVDETEAKAMEKKIRAATFTLEDMLQQFKAVKKMGSLADLMGMIPGFSTLSKKMPAGGVDEKQFARVEAIILSMTPEERRNPDIIGGGRRKRIARGSGTNPGEVNRLLNQFQEMKKMLKRLSGPTNRGGPMKGSKMPRLPMGLGRMR